MNTSDRIVRAPNGSLGVELSNTRCKLSCRTGEIYSPQCNVPTHRSFPRSPDFDWGNQYRAQESDLMSFHLQPDRGRRCYADMKSGYEKTTEPPGGKANPCRSRSLASSRFNALVRSHASHNDLFPLSVGLGQIADSISRTIRRAVRGSWLCRSEHSRE